MRQLLLLSVGMSALSVIPVYAQNSIQSELEPTEAIRNTINSVEQFQQDLNTASGTVPVAAAIDLSSGHVVSSRAQQGELSLRGPYLSPAGDPQYILSLIDENSGEPLEIRLDELEVKDQSNNPVEFQLETLPEAKIPASIIMLIDASGSMSKVMGRVLSSADKLYDKLPEHFHCEAIVFADSTERYGDPTEACDAKNIGLSNVTADGRTYIFTALKSAFRTMNERTDHDQKIVLVLTDGDPSDFDPALFEELKTMKNDTQVLFFWLGNKYANAEHLYAPLADHYVEDPLGAWRYLNEYFGVFTRKINSQAVVTILESP